ncbi:4Fe-4S dicluster domain-containing protein [Capillimicrobium parvum]|uniref:Ferredoxin n=1 Tax=Capillimicrobium parvum TaxID=2884022 RepID=A0A9E7C364_9ACTN|nr:ferredoxin family protein [Capillimicrobium parvum]UGS38429.1 Ferredoxin 1 [Capillimicrobium parvum]
MTYVVGPGCIGSMDRSCIEVCPVDCIYETAHMVVIAPDECIDCGACAPECPVDAIFEQDGMPPEHAEFVAINRAWGGGAAAVDALVEQYLQASE